jgi:SAM-dependent methyltransferase
MRPAHDHEPLEEQNLDLISAGAQVDSLVGSFYNRFPYPWRAYKFDYVDDSDFHARMLSQELGFWNESFLPPRNASIWVAGCGTNQALVTALHFPNSVIIGSDISRTSLEIAERTALELGLSNVRLQEESINDSTYCQSFDYIICTGVLHHTANPQSALTKLANALAPSGVIEVMVYNRFHRVLTSGFQRAIRVFNRTEAQPDFDSDLEVAKVLLKIVDDDSWLANLLGGIRHRHEAALADALINPIEHSFTVRSLASLAENSGLRLVAPCTNPFIQTEHIYQWDLLLPNDELQEKYEQLSDVDRWYITNCLMFEKSPWLWFYLQRKDSPKSIPSTKDMCSRFLGTVFRKNVASQRNLILGDDGRYRLSPKVVLLPTGQPHESVKKIAGLVDGSRTMGDIFELLKIPTNLAVTNHARLHLTSKQFPYLVPATGYLENRGVSCD